MAKNGIMVKMLKCYNGQNTKIVYRSKRQKIKNSQNAQMLKPSKLQKM